MKAREREQIIADGQKQFDRGFLQHHADAAAHFERLVHNVESENICATAGRAHERSEHFERGCFARAVWAEQSENSAASNCETHSIHCADGFARAAKKRFALVHFHQIFNLQREFRHEKFLWPCARPQKCTESMRRREKSERFGRAAAESKDAAEDFSELACCDPPATNQRRVMTTHIGYDLLTFLRLN